ncbi:MAG: hypothetical protein MSO56_08375 [Clostridiales bacterium]|nr:hypothetical protein [Clostridiales bacterium]
MKNIFAAALFAAVLSLSAAQSLLRERVNRLEQERKEEEKTGETRSAAVSDALDKLWCRGLEGIMSYGMNDALGKREAEE